MKKPHVEGFFDAVTCTWTYVVFMPGDADRRCAVIDSVLDLDIHSGRTKTTAADRVINYIQENKLSVQWILETHIHADHVTGAQYIKEKLGGKTGISKHILHVLQTWQNIFHNEDDTPLTGHQFDHIFGDDEEFAIGPLAARIIHTPGHTPVDTTFVVGDALFVGDAMFLPDVGTGRCDFPGGNAEHSFMSTRKLFGFPDDYRMFVGHDYPPAGSRAPNCVITVAEQKKSNIRVREGISKEEFIDKRNKDDQGKDVPKLLLPAIQINLRAGSFGQKTAGVQYIKIPVNSI